MEDSGADATGAFFGILVTCFHQTAGDRFWKDRQPWTCRGRPVTETRVELEVSGIGSGHTKGTGTMKAEQVKIRARRASRDQRVHSPRERDKQGGPRVREAQKQGC